MLYDSSNVEELDTMLHDLSNVEELDAKVTEALKEQKTFRKHF